MSTAPVDELDPRRAHARFRELLRGGLPANSLPGGSRSREIPMPRLDRFDQVLTEAWQRYQSYLVIAIATNDRNRRAEAIHNATRIQQWFLLAPDPIEDVKCEDSHCTNLLELGRKSGLCGSCRVKKSRKAKAR